MKYLKTLSIVFALFLFGCTREVPSSQLEQSSLSSSSPPVQSPSDSGLSSISSQSSSESSAEAEEGPIPQMLENGWHYTTSKWLYGWVKDGQEFVFCHDSMLDFYGLDNQFIRSVSFDSSQLPEDYKLFTASNRIFLLESSLYDLPQPIDSNFHYEPLLYEKDGQEYLSGVTMLDLEGNILLQAPPLDVSQDEDGDFLFSLDGEPVSVKPASTHVTCVNDDLIFLSLDWYKTKGDGLGFKSYANLYYFVPSKNKLVCIGKNFEDGHVRASNRKNACIFFYDYGGSPGFQLGYLDQNGVQYPYPGMIFSDAAMDGNSIFLSYSPYRQSEEVYKFWRTSPDDFILHSIPFPEMAELPGAYIPTYRAKVHLLDENYMLFDNKALNILTGEYGTNEQAVLLSQITYHPSDYNCGTNSHYVAWARSNASYNQTQNYFKIFPFPKTLDEKVYSGYRWDVEDILANMEDFQ